MYKHVFVAGTFDGLHAGHQAILVRACADGERVTVGLTSDEFVKKIKNYDLHSTHYEERRKTLELVKCCGFPDQQLSSTDKD